MIWYLILGMGLFIVAFIIRKRQNDFIGLAQNSVALVDKLIADVDEDEKITLIQSYTNKLLKSLMTILVVIVVALAVGAIPIVVHAYINGFEVAQLDFLSIYGILAISIGATVPFVIPIGKKSKSDYSELSKLLHGMVLDNYNIGQKLFKKEIKRIEKKKLIKNEKFVIVSGLARAGTTSLMNDLSKIEQFATLNYANMPFLMCPNLWAKFYKPKSKELKERSHKDGIKIGLDSNEALEEYFFKVKANDAFINESSLTEYAIPEKDYQHYIDYQTIIKDDDQKIYLAKNNNFILRYKSVREWNADFLMVILYRDPLTHAASLMEKHKDYQKLQSDDPFVLEYMNWLGHHEFGLNQKPFIFEESENFSELSKDSMDYWLKSWINYYSYALKFKEKNTLFVSYDHYCEKPTDTIQHVLERINLKTEIPEYSGFTNKRKPDVSYSQDIYQEALDLYDQLKRN